MSLLLDTTGQAVANYVSSENHAVTSESLMNFGYVFLNKGPFFGNHLAVYITPTGGVRKPLELGKDYDPIFMLPGFGQTVGTEVFGALEFYNPNLEGVLQVSYQALGGNWTFNQNAINNYLNSNYFNGDLQTIVLVPAQDLYLPSSPAAVWPLDSIQAITIAQAALPTISLSVAYVSNTPGAAINAQTQPVQVVNLPDTQKVITLASFTPTNASGPKTINAANTNQIVLQPNSNRQLLEIANLHATAVLYVNFTGAAWDGTKPVGIPISPGATRSYASRVPNTQVTVSSRTAGVPFYILEG